MARIVCQAKGCKNWLKGKQRKFCSEQCNKRTWAQKKRDGKELPTKPINQEFKSEEGNYASIRRGRYYDEFRAKWAESLATGEITTMDVASQLDCKYLCFLYNNRILICKTHMFCSISLFSLFFFILIFL